MTAGRNACPGDNINLEEERRGGEEGWISCLYPCARARARNGLAPPRSGRGTDATRLRPRRLVAGDGRRRRARAGLPGHTGGKGGREDQFLSPRRAVSFAWNPACSSDACVSAAVPLRAARRAPGCRPRARLGPCAASVLDMSRSRQKWSEEVRASAPRASGCRPAPDGCTDSARWLPPDASPGVPRVLAPQPRFATCARRMRNWTSSCASSAAKASGTRSRSPLDPDAPASSAANGASQLPIRAVVTRVPRDATPEVDDLCGMRGPAARGGSARGRLSSRAGFRSAGTPKGSEGRRAARGYAGSRGARHPRTRQPDR